VTDRVDAWVRATCEICSNVRVRIAEVRLVMAGADRGGDRRNLVEFACPVCGLACSQRIDERTTRLLTAAGVDWVVTPAVDSALQRRPGEPGQSR
jgi:hypothetical protein